MRFLAIGLEVYMLGALFFYVSWIRVLRFEDWPLAFVFSLLWPGWLPLRLRAELHDLIGPYLVRRHRP